MFSGIIQELGEIVKVEKYDGGSLFSIQYLNFDSDIKKGDSVSVNGVCLTAIKIKNSIFDVNVIEETLNMSSLSDITEGDFVNLELSLKYNDRITINIDDKIKKYCVYKGSIAIDGISLTIANIDDNMIDVAVIPYTLNHTNLKFKKINNKVNIETDMMSKYVEKILNK